MELKLHFIREPRKVGIRPSRCRIRSNSPPFKQIHMLGQSKLLKLRIFNALRHLCAETSDAPCPPHRLWLPNSFFPATSPSLRQDLLAAPARSASFLRSPLRIRHSPPFPVTPLFAALPKNAVLSPLLAAHPKTLDFKSFACHTYKKTIGGYLQVRAHHGPSSTPEPGE